MNPAIIGEVAKKAIPAIMKVHKTLGMVTEAVETIGGAVKKLGQRWYEMNDIAFKTARTMSLSREQAKAYNDQLITSTRQLAAQYGVTAKELADFQQQYAEAVGRNVILSREQLSNMSALSKITDKATASKLVDEFDKVGVGIGRATAYAGRLQERAKALGVSPSKATKLMADNIKLAASYSFRNGVNDIEKMALKATSMRMDMQSIMNATEKFADIEGAISTSANIQMLGGSFAREFSNPMGAMYEAQADPKAFMDRIFRTIEGKGSYDAKTGAVTFDPVTMRMMRELAKNLGMSHQELNNSAMASVQNKKVEDELKAKGTYGNWDDKQIELIKNLSRTNVDEKTGKHYVTLLDNGEEKKINIENLTEEQLKIAKDSQMTEEGLWNDVADIKTILERVHGRARETKSMKEDVEGAKSWWDSALVSLQDIFMPVVSDITNGFTGYMRYSEGGIVKPIKAALGAIIPGDKYAGDRVPAMLNSGEMVLNSNEQKGLFDILKSIAASGAMIYGGNKLGKRFGMNGLGYNAALGGLIGGGGLSAGNIIGSGAAMFMQNKMMMRGMMPMGMGVNRMGGSLTLMNPTVMMNGQTIMNGSIGDGTLVEELEDIAFSASDATKATKSFSKRLRDLSKRDTFLGRGAKRLFNMGARGRAFRRKSKILRNATGRWIKNSKIGMPIAQRYDNWKLQRHLAKMDGADFSSRIKKSDFVKDLKSLFGGNGVKNVANTVTESTSSASKIGKGVKNVANTVAESASSASKIGSSVAKASGVAKGLGSLGKVVGKGVPILGAALTIGSSISDMSSASSQYDAKIDEIERSGTSELEKARAKDRATKEKNASYGSSIGSAAGAAIGGALGTALGPLGSLAGMWLGEKAGSLIGKGVGSLFGGNEEEKFKEEQNKLFGQDIKTNEDLLKIVKSIESKMPGSGVSKIGIKPTGILPIDMIKMGASAIKALPDIGIFKKVAPISSEKNKSSEPISIGKTDINLNVSGTIKLEGGGKSVDFDLDKLINTPEFKRKLTEIIQKEANVMVNAGKERKEYDTGRQKRA